jgi:transcriptional regulator with XRE-family HTH domain
MKNINAYTFWNRLDDLRAQLNIATLKELSLITNINYRKINGQRTNMSIPKSEDLFTLATALNVSMEYLLTGEPVKDNKKFYPIRIEVIADKLCKVSDQNLSLIENTINLMPIEDKSIKVNVVS